MEQPKRDVRETARRLLQHCGLRYGHLIITVEAGQVTGITARKIVRPPQTAPQPVPLSYTAYCEALDNLLDHFGCRHGRLILSIHDWRIDKGEVEHTISIPPPAVTA